MRGANNPLRILFINHWARDLGGAEHSLVDIIDALSKRAEAHLVTSEEGPLVQKARGAGAVCHIVQCKHPLTALKRDTLVRSALASWKGLLSFASFVGRVRGIVDKTRPAVIHANVPKSHVTLFLLALTGYRGVCCFHLREIFTKGSLIFLIYRLLFPYRRGRILAISEAVKKSLPLPLQQKTTVIYNGVFIPDTPKQHRQSDTVRFIYLGRIVPWKGCHRLIDAFYSLYQSDPKKRMTLSLVGDTLYWDRKYRQDLQNQIIGYGIQSLCEIQPHTSDPYSVLKQHDVFCIASYCEPFGRVVAEASACGLPIAGFGGGGIEEVVENAITGFLVPFGNIEELSHAMEYFVNNPQAIARMGGAGHRRAGQLFNRDIQIPEICTSLINSAKEHEGK